MASRWAVHDLGGSRRRPRRTSSTSGPRSRLGADFIGIANILPQSDGDVVALRPERSTLARGPGKRACRRRQDRR